MTATTDTTQPRADGARFFSWIDGNGEHRSGWYQPGVPPVGATDCTGMDDDQFEAHVAEMNELAHTHSVPNGNPGDPGLF